MYIGKVVRQLTEEGKTVAVYPNMTVAAHTLGISISSISKCINGTRSTAAGYRWEVVKDNSADEMVLEYRIKELTQKLEELRRERYGSSQDR